MFHLKKRPPPRNTHTLQVMEDTVNAARVTIKSKVSMIIKNIIIKSFQPLNHFWEIQKPNKLLPVILFTYLYKHKMNVDLAHLKSVGV